MAYCAAHWLRLLRLSTPDTSKPSKRDGRDGRETPIGKNISSWSAEAAIDATTAIAASMQRERMERQWTTVNVLVIQLAYFVIQLHAG